MNAQDRARAVPAMVPAVVLGFAAFAGWLLSADPDASSTTAVVDWVETLVPAAAGVACLAAGRHAVRARSTWLLVGAGVLAWSAGQAVWSWYEVVLAVEVPFPSAADLGFLLFPLLASVGVATHGGRSGQRRSLRSGLLDGGLVAVSLFALSWVVVLGGMVGGTVGVPFLISVAYPVGDAIMVAMVVHVLSGLQGARTSLWVLGAGLAVMGVADSAFVWAVESGSFSTGGWIDLGWIGAFAVIGVAGVLARDDHRPGATAPLRGTRFGLLLPYVPLSVGVAAIAADTWSSGGDRAGLVLLGTLVALVLARQLLSLMDNQSLLDALHAREVQLTQLALHDPLTGLANRALFTDRLAQAVAGARRGVQPVALLMVDLDDFKQVNDTHGHSAGDALLVEVAGRLQTCARATDTVARLGGDEFAVVLTSGAAADQVAERVLAALLEPVGVGAATVQVSASVGIGETACGRALDGEPGSALTTVLQQNADVAMYAAKAAGKNRWRRYATDLAVLTQPHAQDQPQPADGSSLPVARQHGRSQSAGV